MTPSDTQAALDPKAHQAAMDAMFGEYTNPGNSQAWVDPNWQAAKAKLGTAVMAYLAALPTEAPEPVATVNWPEWATDKHIAEGILTEAETIVSLVIHGHEEQIAEHTGAIKSYAGTLLTREDHRAKYTVARPATVSSAVPVKGEPPEMALLRGPLSRAAVAASFNEWQAREIVAYVDRLREALKPFAVDMSPEHDKLTDNEVFTSYFSLGQLRRARALIGGANG